MKEIRKKLFYDTLVALSENLPNEWWGKEKLAQLINAEHNANVGFFAEELYKLNHSATAHDVCALMNHDRIAINESLDFEKIIIVNDNKFKVATLEETLAEEEKIRATAKKQLWRGGLLKAKRLQDKQIIVDFENEIERVIETFGGKYE